MAKKRFRPQLEQLECRCVPAVTITDGLADFDGNEIVRIVSNNASDFIEVFDYGATIDVEVNGVPTPGSPYGTDVQIIEVYLNGGNDTLTLNMIELDGLSRSYLIKTGRGNDVVNIFQVDIAESGADIEYQISDGGGNDSVQFVSFFTIADNSAVRITAALGGGNDVASFSLGDVVSGSAALAAGASFHLSVDMGRGNDTFGFLVDAEVLESAIDIGLKTGSGDDIVNAIFEDEFDDFANITFNAYLGAGDDAFTANFDSDSDGFGINIEGGADGAAFNLAVWGEKGNDVLQAAKTTDDDSEIVINATVFDIHFNGGAGNDTIVVDLSQKVQGQGLFIGVGGFVILVDGGNGNDRLTVRLSNDSDSSNVFDIAVLAGAGNDWVTFAGEDDGGDPIFVGAYVVIDGGFGKDTKFISGNYPVFDMNFEFLA